MQKKTIFLLLFVIGLLLTLYLTDAMVANRPPEYLYKVIDVVSWKKSQGQKEVVLSPADNSFIHLATKEQLQRIIDKYFADHKSFYILKVRVDKLQGKLVHEVNPGGTTAYYHLYEGVIPTAAVVEATRRP